MSLLVPSAFSRAAVTVSGSVSVSNFPASQPVTGPLTDAELRAVAVPVSGPLTNAQLRAADVIVDQGAGGTAWAVVQATVPWVVDASGATVPVSVQGQPILVDGSAVTQPVSVDELPLPDGAATQATQAKVLSAVNDVALTSILEREKLEIG